MKEPTKKNKMLTLFRFFKKSLFYSIVSVIIIMFVAYFLDWFWLYIVGSIFLPLIACVVVLATDDMIYWGDLDEKGIPTDERDRKRFLYHKDRWRRVASIFRRNVKQANIAATVAPADSERDRQSLGSNSQNNVGGVQVNIRNRKRVHTGNDRRKEKQKQDAQKTIGFLATSRQNREVKIADGEVPRPPAKFISADYIDSLQKRKLDKELNLSTTKKSVKKTRHNQGGRKTWQK